MSTKRVLKPCGTPAAYYRHWRRGEPACEPCLAALRAQRSGCGTYKKAMSHWRKKEPLDDLCRMARNEYRMTHHRKKATR